MIDDARRSKRYNRFLPIGISALDLTSNKIVAGPFPGRIINISRHGACLLMSRLTSNSFHMFHSVNENDRICLQLIINIQPEIINCIIPGRPVWLDTFREDDFRAYKLGIEFINDADSRDMMYLEQVVKKR